MAAGPLGVVRAGTAVVATAFVGVLGTTPGVGVDVAAPVVVIGCGVTGVPPFAIVVCAAAVCLANSSICAIGFSADGNGETNNPVGIKVAVATGAEDSDCSQAEINIVVITKMKIISRPRLFFLMDSPLSMYSKSDGST